LPASSVGLRCFQINNKKRRSFLTRAKYETAKQWNGKNYRNGTSKL